jgi:organic radical activating enzyme
MPQIRTAPLVEVFRSIQGEGAFVGEPQSFVRLGICPLRCRYCDSEHTWESAARWRAERDGESWDRENPATVADVVAALAFVESGEGARTVSLTGGEPLVHADFLAELIPQIRVGGRRVHLETAGVHAAPLERLAGLLDHVSADVKLTSTMETGDFRDSNRRFLETCARLGFDTSVKCVITPRVREEELDAALEMVAAIGANWLFILQPVTPMRLEPAAVDPQRLAALTARARARLPNVRVIPQVHRILRVP